MSDASAAARDELLETYEVRSDSESLVDGTAAEGTNASRYAIAGLLTPDHRRAAWGVLHQAFDFGFSQAPFESLNFRDPEHLAGPRRTAELGYLFAHRDLDDRKERLDTWADLNSGQLQARLAFLVAGLCGHSERETIAAAVALLDGPNAEETVLTPGGVPGGQGQEPFIELAVRLSARNPTDRPDIDWEGDDWSAFSRSQVMQARGFDELDDAISRVAAVRVAVARGSKDVVTRELAAALDMRGPDDRDDGSTSDSPRGQRQGTKIVSTMVHGTWGWKGDWWYPGGDFHRYAKDGLRTNTYAGNRPFGWSGRLRDADRVVAAQRLKDWIADPDAALDGVQTVFAHSYGGEVAARAALMDAPIGQLVLLSVPSSPPIQQAVTSIPSVDIRLKWDIVLALAGRGQWLAPGPTLSSIVIDETFWRHGATHSPQLWQEEGLAAKAGLP